ncbi:MAG: mechanosensitive ion channel domain-containing protein [Alphaproteobacteria bacterium]
MSALIASYGLSVVGAIIILIVGLWFSGWARRVTEQGLARTGKVDATLSSFFGSLVKYTIIAFTVIAVLSEFGVQTASLVAVFGAAGLAIGLALQGTLGNVAAGVMLLLFRPFKVGDYIDGAGVSGTVKSISLFVTELATPDNVQIIAPNSQMWGAAIKNFSAHPTRRVDFLIGIDYGDDINTAIATLTRVSEGDSRAHKDPAPFIVVGELGDSSVNLIVRLWVDAGDYWGVKFDLTKAFKEQLEADGISIPFPQQDVHMHQAAA